MAFSNEPRRPTFFYFSIGSVYKEMGRYESHIHDHIQFHSSGSAHPYIKR